MSQKDELSSKEIHLLSGKKREVISEELILHTGITNISDTTS